MAWIDYRELRRRLKVEEVLAWMDWHANERRGDYLRGSCPFCRAKLLRTAKSCQGREFAVHRHRKLFHCFRCKQGGNLLDLWSRYYEIDLKTAANELSQHLIDQPHLRSSNSESQPLRPPI
ncbi:MAG: CHC2 zinc finger domain-containing protein [Pirellula staleyi]|nr:CHC2 zinc finger domain-containing protein [Planctomycetota bacterium]